MANALRREPFDPERTFVCCKTMVFSGRKYAPGQPFDKSLATVRRLRQMYEQRMVEMGPADTGAEAMTRGGTDFGVMTMDELRAYLAAKGTVPRLNWDRAKLLEKAMDKAA